MTVELGSSVCPRKEREATSKTRFRMASLASVAVLHSSFLSPSSNEFEVASFSNLMVQMRTKLCVTMIYTF